MLKNTLVCQSRKCCTAGFSYFNNISPIYYIDMYGVISNKMTNNFLSDKGSLNIIATGGDIYVQRACANE